MKRWLESDVCIVQSSKLAQGSEEHPVYVRTHPGHADGSGQMMYNRASDPADTADNGSYSP